MTQTTQTRQPQDFNGRTITVNARVRAITTKQEGFRKPRSSRERHAVRVMQLPGYPVYIRDAAATEQNPIHVVAKISAGNYVSVYRSAQGEATMVITAKDWEVVTEPAPEQSPAPAVSADQLHDSTHQTEAAAQERATFVRTEGIGSMVHRVSETEFRVYRTRCPEHAADTSADCHRCRALAAGPLPIVKTKPVHVLVCVGWDGASFPIYGVRRGEKIVQHKHEGLTVEEEEAIREAMVADRERREEQEKAAKAARDHELDRTEKPGLSDLVFEAATATQRFQSLLRCALVPHFRAGLCVAKLSRMRGGYCSKKVRAGGLCGQHGKAQAALLRSILEGGTVSDKLMLDADAIYAGLWTRDTERDTATVNALMPGVLGQPIRLGAPKPVEAPADVQAAFGLDLVRLVLGGARAELRIHRAGATTVWIQRLVDRIGWEVIGRGETAELALIDAIRSAKPTA